MPGIIISDASCLILLNKIGELLVLKKLFGKVIITQIIASEYGNELPEWIEVINPCRDINQSVWELNLDEGEISAIALALEIENSLLIIDELKGRKIARELGIRITGTIGLLVDAKESGYIPLLKPILQKIRQTNFRISENIFLEILAKAGE